MVILDYYARANLGKTFGLSVECHTVTHAMYADVSSTVAAPRSRRRRGCFRKPCRPRLSITARKPSACASAAATTTMLQLAAAARLPAPWLQRA